MVTGPGSDRSDWRDDAACAGEDTDLFFVEQGGSVDEARWICAGCPVAGPCLEVALVHPERFGIWAGTTPRDRVRLLRQRADHGDVDVAVDPTIEQAKEAG